MKSFVITIQNHDYSTTCANRCINSAQQFNVDVEYFYAITKETAINTLNEHNLSWNWADDNRRLIACPHTGLEQFPYRANDFRTKIACSLSHYLLWLKCIELDQEILILEHDAVFINPLPKIDFYGAIQINDPSRGGYNGKFHSRYMTDRNVSGVHPLTRKRPINSKVPDGFSGNSAYIIKPWAAKEFVAAFKKYGVWPNDATICLQLFPWLEEYYPFITEIHQSESTTSI